MERSLADLMGNTELFGDDDREEVARQVEVVLSAAQAWRDGDLTLLEAAKLGGTRYRGHLVPGRTRAIAMLVTPNDDPRKGDLREMVDQLILMKGGLITEFGVFGKAELMQSDRAVEAVFGTHPRRYTPVDPMFMRRK